MDMHEMPWWFAIVVTVVTVSLAGIAWKLLLDKARLERMIKSLTENEDLDK